jgi:hypothetical protein
MLRVLGAVAILLIVGIAAATDTTITIQRNGHWPADVCNELAATAATKEIHVGAAILDVYDKHCAATK